MKGPRFFIPVILFLLYIAIANIGCLKGYSFIPVVPESEKEAQSECAACHLDVEMLELVADPIDEEGDCSGGEG
jgi:hypothetical protein